MQPVAPVPSQAAGLEFCLLKGTRGCGGMPIADGAAAQGHGREGRARGSWKELVVRTLLPLFLGSTSCIFLLWEAIALFLDANSVSPVNSLFWKEACVCFPFGA